MKTNDEENWDKIIIKDLLLRCIIGINESERREKQDLIINAVLWSNLDEATETDDINKTVDYKVMNKNIIQLVEKSNFFLIETLAEKIAEVCLQHEKVKKVKVTVEKPNALRFTKSVGVVIVRKKGLVFNMAVAFLALGSNIEPEKNILGAVKLLSRRVKILKASAVYLTEPILHKSQPKYFNCVIEIETDIEPFKLKFDILRAIEEELGRRRVKDKYASRTIDIDLILYGDLHILKKELIIPDPKIQKRAFLAIPLYEIEPELLLPVTYKPIREVSSRFKNHEITKLTDFSETLHKLIRCLG